MVKDVIKMKNVIKKIAATAMAITLLGAGTVVTKTIAPQFDNSITASAACNHVVGSTSWSSWESNGTELTVQQYFPFLVIRHYEKRTCKCIKCGRTLSTQRRYRDQWCVDVSTGYFDYVYY